MQVGERVTMTMPSRVIEEHITHTDSEKSCGWVRVTPELKESGTILGFKTGWFWNRWIVGLDSGQIIEVPA